MQKGLSSLLALGNAALDVITVVERLPLPDEKMQTEAVRIDAGGSSRYRSGNCCASGHWRKPGGSHRR